MSRPATIPVRTPDVADSEIHLLRKIAASLAASGAAPVTGTALVSAGRTATTSSATINTAGFRGVLVWLDVTAVAGGSGTYLRIDGMDPLTGKQAVLVSFNVLRSSVSTYLHAYGAGIAAGTSGLAAAGDRGGLLPPSMRLTVFHGDAFLNTYSVSYALIP